jgi:hypothetical protein
LVRRGRAGEKSDFFNSLLDAQDDWLIRLLEELLPSPSICDILRYRKETVMARANKPPSKPPDPVAVTPAVKSTVEREIKLAVDDHFRLPPLPGIPLPRRLLTSTYFDTSQYDLAHAGITLRHRVERGKQAWQLKLPLMKDRQEIEMADRQSIPPTISDGGGSCRLRPCGSGAWASACAWTMSLSQTSRSTTWRS